MNLACCQSLVRELERYPSRAQAYYGDLEAAIAWLMDATFEATDPNEKAPLAAVELRARLLLERFRKRGTSGPLDARRAR